jgi:hypothetical protein
MQEREDAVERLKRIQAREAAKAKTEGHPCKVSPIQRRMISRSVEIRARPVPDDLLYQHTVLCQTVLPFRDPGPEVRVWEREQGNISLLLEAGRTKDPYGHYVEVGLPFGPAVRLILCHINTEALRTGSPAIEVKDSLTAFVQRLQGFAPNGREVRKFKDQLIRLSASTMRLATSRGGHTLQTNTHIVRAFTLWAERFEGEQFLAPQQIILGTEYFESLQEHAVPLDERAVSALAHSSMALDVYCWLAQRLHRVDPIRGQFLAWTNMYEQFGQGYERIRDFRRVFIDVVKMVKAQYPAARFCVNKTGMILGNSPPPVPSRTRLIGNRPLLDAPQPFTSPESPKP